MSEDLDDWKPMSDAFQSLSFNSYTSGQAGANLPFHSLPHFNSQMGSQTSRHKSALNVKLFINGFPSDLTEIGLKTFLKRIGCKLLSIKIIESKTQLGQHFSFAEFESTKEAQKAIELIKSQSIYKLFVSFASTEANREERNLLIDRENKEFKQQLSKQIEMKQKIDLGPHVVINANTNSGSLSPINSDTGSHDSSVLDVLSPLAKSNKLLAVLEKTDDDCPHCNNAQPVRHLHYILSEQEVLDPNALPALIHIKCLVCDQSAPDIKLCSNCRVAAYCGLKCQKNDWRRHRADCKPAEEAVHRLNSTSIANKSSNSFGKTLSEKKRKTEDSVDSTPKSLQNAVKESQSLGKSSPPKEKSNVATPVVAQTIPITNGLGHIEDEDQEPKASTVVPKEPVVRSCSPAPLKESVPEAVTGKVIERTVETEELTDGEDKLLLCFGRNPTDFYLQKASAEEKMGVFAEQLAKKKDDFPVLPQNDLKVGSLCGGIYSEDGDCYRARIASQVDDKTFGLYFIDYGNTEAVETKDIKSLPELYFDCKAQAVHCSLHNIAPINGKWDKESIRAFGQIGESNEFSKAKVFEKTTEGLYKIDLINKNGDSICKLLAQKKLATIVSESSTSFANQSVKTPISSPTRPSKELSDSPVVVQGSPKVVFNRSSVKDVGRSLKTLFPSEESPVSVLKSCLDVVESNSSFECIITDPFNVEEFQYFATNYDTSIEKMMVELATDYPSKAVNFTPKADDIVVVKASDNDFYRSYVLQTSDTTSTAKMFMIDGGFVEDVSYCDIFTMNEKYLKYPSYVLLLVPETRPAAVLVELTATREVALLKGTFIRRDERTFIELDNNSIEVMDFRSAVKLMKESLTKLGQNIDSIDGQIDYSKRLPQRELTLLKSFEALVLYQDKTDPEVFFIASDSDSFQKIMELCGKHSQRFSDSIRVNPLLGEVYLVQSVEDNEWYRGLITGVTEDKCKVLYIDFGNEEQIDSKYVMELTADMQPKNLKPIAIKCKVESSELSAEDLKKKIEKASDGTYLLKLEATKRADALHLVKVY